MEDSLRFPNKIANVKLHCIIPGTTEVSRPHSRLEKNHNLVNRFVVKITSKLEGKYLINDNKETRSWYNNIKKLNDFFLNYIIEKTFILIFHFILVELLTLLILPKLWQGLIRDLKL